MTPETIDFVPTDCNAQNRAACMVHFAEMNAKLDQMLDLQKKHDRELYGNGKPGIKMRVHDLERTEKGRVWFGRVVVTAGVLIVLEALAAGFIFAFKVAV